MNVKFLSVAGLALAALSFAPAAKAAYITSNGTVQAMGGVGDVDPSQPNPPLIHITSLDLVTNGRVFTNQVSGDQFAPGGTVRTVGMVTVASATNGENFPIGLVGPPQNTFHFIFAVEGEIIAGDGVSAATARFTGGSLWLASRTIDQTGGAFSRDNPLTWNFDDAFARYDLAPPDDIINGEVAGLVSESGNAPPITPVSAVNVSSVNTDVGVQSDGIFAFLETDFAGFPGMIDPTGGFPGDQWLRDVEGGGLGDMLFPFINHTISPPGEVTLNAAQLAQLNVIWAEATGVNGVFHGDGQGAFTPGVGGDYNSDLGGRVYIGAVVPEPSSLAIFGLLCGGAAVRFTKRRNKKA